uniref:Uncharacterized protein n=1 Tax=Tetranychus urticae TaxID=32264 RepID=T1KF37_TETUR
MFIRLQMMIPGLDKNCRTLLLLAKSRQE